MGTSRLALDKPNENRPKSKSWVFFSIMSAVFLFIFWKSPLFFLVGEQIEKYFTFLPSLSVKEVRVEAEWPLDGERVRSWLPPLQKKSLLLVNPYKLIDLLKSKPWVKEATIKKEFPSRLLVHIATKKAKAILSKDGNLYFVDDNTLVIERATGRLLSSLDLPVFAYGGTNAEKTWDSSKMWSTFQKLSEWDKSKKISDYVFEHYPYFKLYLSTPRAEVALDFRNYVEQLSSLTTLLNDPPNKMGEVWRINLLFPKKAIVSAQKSN